MCSIDHDAHILVSSRRFLGNAPHGRAENQDALAAKLIDDCAPVPLFFCLMTAHLPPRSVARRTE